MKIYQLLTLSLALFFHSVQADSTASCDVAFPFKALGQSDAAVYQLTDVLAKSTSPYPTLQNEKSQNKVQFVNFWAAWCAPCRQELPLLNNIQNDKRAEITLINVGDKQATAEKILAELNVTHLKTRLADSEILSAFSLMGLPASLVFVDEQVYLGMGKLKDEKAINNWLSCLSQ